MTAANTATDMLGMLRRHYIADEDRPAGIFAAEIASPGGHRRADLIWHGVTAAAGHQLHGHEIKVTRADLLVELADPTKSDPWQRYCDRWWLVVAEPELIDDLQLPDTWGVMAPPSGRRTRSMTILRPAPKLQPADQTPALRTIATRLHWALHRAEAARDSAHTDLARVRQANHDLQARLPRDNTTRSRQQQLVDQIVTRLGGPAPEGGDRIGRAWTTNLHVDDVVAELTEIGGARHALERDQRAVASLAEQLRRLLDDVDRPAIRDLARHAHALTNPHT